jgi:hypothetical protein
MKNKLPWRRRWRAVTSSTAATILVVLAGFVGIAASPASAAGGTAPRIPTPQNWQFTAGGYSVFAVTATGSPTPTFSVSGTLPPGILYQATNFGALVFFGSPPANIAGRSYTVTITAANGVSPNAVPQLYMTSGTTSTTTSVSASPNPAVGGRPITYTARVSPMPNGGQVTVYRADGSPVLACIGIPVSTNPVTATCGNPLLQAGTYNLHATFSGFRQFLPSSGPGTYRLVVNPAPPAYWLGTTNGRVFSLAGAGFLGRQHFDRPRAGRHHRREGILRGGIGRRRVHVW